MKNRTKLTNYRPGAALRLAALVASGLAAVQSSQGALLHHWDFNTDGTDSVGGSNASLVGTAAISGGSLNLPGGATFANYASVNLGTTISNSPTLTVECWYTQNAAVSWSKAWMFGTDTGAGEPALGYIDFTPRTGLGGNPPKIDFDTTNAPEVNAAGSAALSADGTHQYHAVAVYDSGKNLMSFFIDNVLIATNNMGGNNVQGVGFNTGRFGAGFFYGDPDLNGSINDIRIYNSPLNALQVAVNFAAGPDVVPSSYTPSVVHLNVGSTNLLGGEMEQADVTADFGSITGVVATGAVTNWSSSASGVVTVNATGLISAVGAGNATISATVGGVTGSVVIFVAAVQPSISQDLQPVSKFAGSPLTLTVGALGGDLTYRWFKNSTLIPAQTNSSLVIPSVALSDDADYSVMVSNVVGTAMSSTAHLTVSQQTLDHRYSFDSDVRDSIGGLDGSPVNNITFSDGKAVFPGTAGSGPNGDYILLPSGIISVYSSVTFELWATIQPNGNWNQICAFGDQSGTAGNTYLAVIPHSGAGDYRMTIKTGGNERATSGAAVQDKNVPVHLIAVYDADSNIQRLYADGKLVSTRATTIDIANVNNALSLLGRSLFNGDASLKGSIDEFRIWAGPLTPLQIAVNEGLGATNLNTNPGAFLGLSSVSVGNTTMVGGTTQPATALANFANVMSVPFNSQVTNWVSSDTNVATVTAAGVIKAVGTGSAMVSATAYGSTASVTISVSSVQPMILAQPASMLRQTGGGVVFNVTANGGQLQYQWKKGAATLTGQTNSTLILDNLSAADIADYQVVIMNPAGSTNSALAHLDVTSILPGGYPGVVLGDSPSAYWRLGEASGVTAVDRFGTNNATYSGAVLGGAGAIFGDSDTSISVIAGAKAEAAYSARLNNPAGPFTAEVWARPANTVASAVLSSENRTGNDRSGYAIYHNLNGNFWQFQLGGTNGIALDLRGTSAVTTNWHHIVASYDGTTARLYVDGNLEASGTVAIPPFHPNGSAVLDIGVENGGANPHTGDIDEAAIYGYALSASQVTTHYAAGLYGFSTSPLVLSDAASAVNYVGSSAQTFSVTVGGSLPITYQWKHEGTNIPGATSATLVINNPRLSDAGSYQLFASNSIGSTNSSLVSLTMMPSSLSHRWSFTTDGTDSIGGATANPVGSAAFSGGKLQLPGGGTFANFAEVDISGTLYANSSVTVETWFTLNGLPDWSKLWMFGDGSGGEPALAYIDFTPRSGLGGNPPKSDFDPNDTGESNTSGGANPAALVTGKVYHAVVAYDAGANTQRLYLNGVLVDTGSMAGRNIQSLFYTTMRFGSGFFYADQDLNGAIDEMRVYAGIMASGDVVNDYLAGPDTLVPLGTAVSPVTLHVAKSGGNVILTWTAGALEQADSLTGPWTTVNGAASPYSVAVTSAAKKFYRVRVQ